MTTSGLLDSTVIAIFFLIGAVWFALLLHRSKRALQFLQQDSYNNRRTLRWLITHRDRLLLEKRVLYSTLAISTSLTGVVIFEQRNLDAVVAVVGVVTGIYLWRSRPRRTDKKPLVFTGRARRILILSLVSSVTLVATLSLTLRENGLAVALGLSIWPVLLLAPLTTLIANYVLHPLQSIINRLYVGRARRKMNRFTPLVIGITGSYGKTTTKHILASLLAAKYDVLMTPKSYNTLLGVARVINDDLEQGHEVFVVEAGAYRVGEIRRTAKLVRAKFAIITAIGPQHLERFGSIEAISKAKAELIQALPADGTAILNGDDSRCLALTDLLQEGIKVRTVGSSTPDRQYLASTEIELTETGSRFALSLEGEDQTLEVSLPLLGRHNIGNFLLAAAAAIELGVLFRDLPALAEQLEPPPNRLQTLRGRGGVTVIDNSYSSNPSGSKHALEVLSEAGAGRKVIVTPGFVELGEQSEFFSHKFGVQIASVCDRVILVGASQTRTIRAGLDDADFPANNVSVVPNIEEATRVLGTFLTPGDVVLFENDLPDLYSET